MMRRAAHPLRGLVAVLTVLSTLLMTASATAAPQREFARYDEERFTVSSVVGGYGWAAWVVVPRTDKVPRRARLVIASPGGRTKSVALKRSPGRLRLLRGANATGRARVVVAAGRGGCLEIDRGRATCDIDAIDVETGRRTRPAWLVDFFGSGVDQRWTGAALDGRTVLEVRPVDPPLSTEAVPQPVGSCEATLATPGVQQRTVLPAVPDCNAPSDVQLRGRIATFRAGRPSASTDDHFVEHVYALDLRAPTTGWVRVGAHSTGKLGNAGATTTAIVGHRAVVLTTPPDDDAPALTGSQEPGEGTLTSWDFSQPGVPPTMGTPVITPRGVGARLASRGTDLVVAQQLTVKVKSREQRVTVVRRVGLPAS
ncbi:MAG: hypothetical protein Q7T55_04285 [Solirubrobacteraceae bacterium]|nr:hypothetical protein [Solirubrobacteraceae bacterium]